MPFPPSMIPAAGRPKSTKPASKKADTKPAPPISVTGVTPGSVQAAGLRTGLEEERPIADFLSSQATALGKGGGYLNQMEEIVGKLRAFRGEDQQPFAPPQVQAPSFSPAPMQDLNAQNDLNQRDARMGGLLFLLGGGGAFGAGVAGDAMGQWDQYRQQMMDRDYAQQMTAAQMGNQNAQNNFANQMNLFGAGEDARRADNAMRLQRDQMGLSSLVNAGNLATQGVGQSIGLGAAQMTPYTLAADILTDQAQRKQAEQQTENAKMSQLLSAVTSAHQMPGNARPLVAERMGLPSNALEGTSPEMQQRGKLAADQLALQRWEAGLQHRARMAAIAAEERATEGRLQLGYAGIAQDAHARFGEMFQRIGNDVALQAEDNIVDEGIRLMRLSPADREKRFDALPDPLKIGLIQSGYRSGGMDIQTLLARKSVIDDQRKSNRQAIQQANSFVKEALKKAGWDNAKIKQFMDVQIGLATGKTGRELEDVKRKFIEGINALTDSATAPSPAPGAFPGQPDSQGRTR